MDGYVNYMTWDVIHHIAEDEKRMAKLMSLDRVDRYNKIEGYTCASCRELKYPRDKVDFAEVLYQINLRLKEKGAA